MSYKERNFVRINLFFQGFVAETVEDVAAYELSDFAADLGGQMGLFLGASINSLSEFLELLVDL